jgi:large subunit ribosomal protein L25
VEAIALEIEERESIGSLAAKKSRKNGVIPAVIYSRGSAAKMLQIKESSYIKQAYGRGPTQLFTLTSGNKVFNGQLALIKDIHREPIKDKVLHIDFLAVSADYRITVNVPLELRGESPAVKLGAVLNQSAHEIEIECLPTEIPNMIVVDITKLTEDHPSIHARDVELPAGTKLKSDAGLSIVSAVKKREEEVKAVAAVEAAPAAGAAAPAAAGAKGAAPAAGGKAAPAAKAPAAKK